MGLRKAHGRQTDVLFVVLFPPALLRLFDLRQLSMGAKVFRIASAYESAMIPDGIFKWLDKTKGLGFF